MGKRERVTRIMDRAGIFDLILRVRQRARAPVLSVLCYHSLGDPGEDYGFDADVVDATAAEFRAQLALVSRYFTVIDMARLGHCMEHGDWPPSPLLITFDDGYRACLDVALPILDELGLPATFFIATEYVSERCLFWWDKINYFVKMSRVQRLRIEYPWPMEWGPGARQQAVAALLRLVKHERGLDVERFLYGLAAAANVEWSRDLERQIADELIMTWDDVRALGRAGMDIGSHTRSHRVLQTLDADSLDDELAGSRADIAAAIGTLPRAIAYPVGFSIGKEPEIRRAVKRAGYDFGFTCEAGVNWLWRGMDRLGIQRVPVMRAAPLSALRGLLALPV